MTLHDISKGVRVVTDVEAIEHPSKPCLWQPDCTFADKLGTLVGSCKHPAMAGTLKNLSAGMQETPAGHQLVQFSGEHRRCRDGGCQVVGTGERGVA